MTIGFYGRRNGRRLRPDQMTLLETVAPQLSVTAAALEGGLRSLFEEKFEQIWMEIGFGAGHHLIHQMALNPDVAFLGIEPFRNGVVNFLRQLPLADAERVKIFQDDVRLLWPFFPSCSVDRIFVLFPDPWPKKRHHKRRLVNEDFLNHLTRILKKTGTLFLASDDAPYVQQMFDLCHKHEQLIPVAGLFDSHPETWPSFPSDWPLTRYAEKAFSQGKKCAHMIFSKK